MPHLMFTFILEQEIAEEHFVPPPTLYALSPSSPEMMAKYIGGVHNYNTASSAIKEKDGLMEDKIVEERELGEEELNDEYDRMIAKKLKSLVSTWDPLIDSWKNEYERLGLEDTRRV